MTIPEQAVQAVEARIARLIRLGSTPYEVAKEAITAAAPHLAAVRVKKLEWTNSDEKRNDEWFCATDATPSYSIMRWWLDDARDEVGHFEVEGLGEDQFGTLDEAKAAAQVDYEARVWSQIEVGIPATDPSAGRAAVLEEACAKIRAMIYCYEGDTAQAFEAQKALVEIENAIRALHPLADKPDEAGVQGELDWVKIAKLAGEHGIRYQTNERLLRFLAGINAGCALHPVADKPDEAGAQGERFRDDVAKVYAWLREPDWNEEWDLCGWLNRRPSPNSFALIHEQWERSTLPTPPSSEVA